MAASKHVLLFAAIVTVEKWFRPVSNVALGILLVIFPVLITNQITMIRSSVVPLQLFMSALIAIGANLTLTMKKNTDIDKAEEMLKSEDIKGIIKASDLSLEFGST